MKNPPSAGAAADAHDSLRRHRAFPQRLTEQHGADRWLDVPDQRVATLNGEENGTDLYGFLELAWRGRRVLFLQETNALTAEPRPGVASRRSGSWFAASFSCCDACAHRSPVPEKRVGNTWRRVHTDV